MNINEIARKIWDLQQKHLQEKHSHHHGNTQKPESRAKQEKDDEHFPDAFAY